MRITNPNPVNADSVSNQAARTDSTTAPIATAPNASSASSSLSLIAFSLVPSFELLSLNAALSQLPPVRQDVLAETIRRLASGDLQDANAVQQTANAILGG